ncbi:MAG: hypothetical protein WB647_21475 [Roseiarcus sp.]|uniref:hypothetical protein n=2 Tax=Roseiarcus sp. TaxID=1969460 RepID=UPI003C5F9EC0
MQSNSAGCGQILRRPPTLRLLALALNFAAAGIAVPDLAAAGDIAPLVSPDRIDDVPSTKVDPFPAFDNFAWRAFIALNWPSRTEADHRGEPDRERMLGDSGPRVWETFKSRYELFEVGQDGKPAAPSPWASYEGLNPCGAEVENRVKTLASFVPYADFNQPGFSLGEPLNPLVAQNRTYTRYEIRINRAEYDAIAATGWSESKNLPNEDHPADLPIGSIAIKASWRLMTEADTPAIRSRYYIVKDAEVVDVANSLVAGRALCSKSDIGLVGFHIMIKTRYRPQWLWSTFEHVDNVPPAGEGEAREPDARDAGAPYSYYDASEPDRKLPLLGSPESLPVSASNPPQVDPAPMQVTRRHPVHPSTMAMNRAYWTLPGIKGTVWEHYMLVASQWPTVIIPRGPQNDGTYFPGLTLSPGVPREPYQSDDPSRENKENLANTTMETYLQDAPSSCMACHASLANARGRDFAGILSGLH